MIRAVVTAIKEKEILSNELFLKRSIKTLWALLAVTFASYLYFVGAITFSVVERQGLEQQVKELLSDISTQELKYLAIDRSMTKGLAISLGLGESGKITFSARNQNVALNANR